MDGTNSPPHIVNSEFRYRGTVMSEVPMEPPTLQRSHTPPEEEPPGDMDPISAIASVAGLLAVAVNLVKGTYFAAQSAKKYCKELTLLGDEIATLMGLLFALKQSLSRPITELSDVGTPSVSGESPGTNTPSSRSSSSESGFEFINLGKAQGYLAEQMLKEIVVCQSTLEEVELLLSKAAPIRHNALTTVTKQLSWSLKKMDICALTGKLERHKLTFVLILSSQGT